MGIDVESARFLLRCRKKGVSFAHTVSIGRQNLMLGNSEITNLFREFGFAPHEIPQLAACPEGERPFAEPLFRGLGAEKIEAMDASSYEGAEIIHDLNDELPESLRHRFGVVCEFGSLEHVFNFPVAMRNCMGMVRTGGHFIWVTPANNCFGHGFYQFSPELAYRVFSEANGFEITEIVAVEYGPRRRWYSVADPLHAHARVQVINNFPVYMFVCAKRISEVEPFRTPPQQSDYFSAWNAHAEEEEKPAAAGPPPAPPSRRWKDSLIEGMPKLIRALQAVQNSSLNRRFSFRNRTSFLRVDKDERTSGP